MRSLARSVGLWTLVGSPMLVLGCKVTTPTPGADAGACPVELTTCGDVCTDTKIDPTHCGGCNVACEAGETCAEGKCVVVCPASRVLCNGACVDPSRDRGFCGASGDCGGDAAGVACADGFVCNGAGACALSCQDGLVDCGGTCIDPKTDQAFCGASPDCTGTNAGVACDDGFACIAGVCALSCQAGLVDCGGTCVDPKKDEAFCGATGDCAAANAGVVCDAGFECAGGVCKVSCPGGLTACGGTCADLATSTSFCGSCNVACAAGETCSSGQCCAGGLESCGGACVDPQSDEANCGGCGTACPATAQCTAGKCVCPTLSPLQCGSECVNPFNDDANCGACGTACLGGKVCFAGACNADPTFQISYFGGATCGVVDHTAATGYDFGGIAVTGENLFVTGEDQTARFDLNLEKATPFLGNRYDGIFSDLRTGRVYTLANAGVPIAAEEGGLDDTLIDSFVEIDPASGELLPGVTMLSESINVDGDEGDAGMFSGVGRLVLHTGDEAFDVRIADGTVTQIGAVDISNARYCNTWARWGLVESFGGDLHLAYVNQDDALMRTNMSDSTTAIVSQFVDLSNMCSITFQPALARWYFHHQGDSQFTTLPSAEETAGYCEAGWCTDSGCFCPPSQPTVCDGACTDLSSDPLNCASCGTECLANGVCDNSVCACPPELPNACMTACADVQTDTQNCGVCGTKCLANGVCDTGVCGCPAGLPDVCPTACTNKLTDAQNCGSCGNICSAATPGCAAGTCVAVATFAGVKKNFPATELGGWTQCFSDDYGGNTPLSTILSACSGSNLMLACRQAGSPTITVAGHAPRADVIFDTGTGNTPHDANGVGWYYSSSYSWGFALQGDPIQRNSCDIIASPNNGNVGPNGDSRICWHTGGGNINGGWRCGTQTSLGGGAGWERVVYQADF